MSLNFNDINWYMMLAHEEALKGELAGEVPIGAVVVSENNKVLAKAHNTKESQKIPTGHAEIEALNLAAKVHGDWRLNNCKLFVTLEPCPMCLSALIHARVSEVYFGAYDKKGGSLSLGYNLHLDKRLNHSFKVIGGIKHYQCSKYLSDFFKQRRKAYKVIK